ncbi:ribose 5-phosphate isomerase B [candidate division WOR-3 bacterium]|nr:ribose 5-phosphate isomerase B [candidate division WOR-3 bacterium]
MILAIGSDHRGFELKKKLVEHLLSKGIEVCDEGPFNAESVDYPIYAFSVGEKISQKNADLGILICGSGIGMSIAANRIKGIRAALCTTREQVISSRRHNDANVLVLAADLTTEYLAKSWVDDWLKEKFEGGRHCKRIDILDK